MTPEELTEGEKLMAAAIADSGSGDCNTDAWADWCHENGDRLIAEIRDLREAIAKGRVDSGWCAECESNTHPNWCKHSKAAGHDLAKRCFVPGCCGTGDRPKDPAAKS